MVVPLLPGGEFEVSAPWSREEPRRLTNVLVFGISREEMNEMVSVSQLRKVSSLGFDVEFSGDYCST